MATAYNSKTALARRDAYVLALEQQVRRLAARGARLVLTVGSDDFFALGAFPLVVGVVDEQTIDAEEIVYDVGPLVVRIDGTLPRGQARVEVTGAPA